MKLKYTRNKLSLHEIINKIHSCESPTKRDRLTHKYFYSNGEELEYDIIAGLLGTNNKQIKYAVIDDRTDRGLSKFLFGGDNEI